jgi:transcription initiation factor IIE alpha subunit
MIILRDPLMMEILTSMVGLRAIEAVKILISYKEVNEYVLAEKLNEKINKIRMMMYKLHREKIVTFRKVWDKEKNGMHIYGKSMNAASRASCLDGEKRHLRF